jgi:hypothetical protein
MNCSQFIVVGFTLWAVNLCEPCFGENHTGENKMQLDQERLSQAKKKTTVSGQYMFVWNKVMNYMQENKFQIDMSDYLITFDEDNESYFVYFIKPYKQPVLGGGGAKVQVRKNDMHVYDFRFSR